jgi:hypothetical protein
MTPHEEDIDIAIVAGRAAVPIRAIAELKLARSDTSPVELAHAGAADVEDCACMLGERSVLFEERCPRLLGANEYGAAQQGRIDRFETPL